VLNGAYADVLSGRDKRSRCGVDQAPRAWTHGQLRAEAELQPGIDGGRKARFRVAGS
jgi:hypothetical protein